MSDWSNVEKPERDEKIAESLNKTIKACQPLIFGLIAMQNVTVKLRSNNAGRQWENRSVLPMNLILFEAYVGKKKGVLLKLRPTGAPQEWVHAEIPLSDVRKYLGPDAEDDINRMIKTDVEPETPLMSGNERLLAASEMAEAFGSW